MKKKTGQFIESRDIGTDIGPAESEAKQAS